MCIPHIYLRYYQLGFYLIFQYTLYQYLNHYPKQCLFGLSGSAYPFVPGSAILFDNKKIHCTSSFTGVKLGLALRYRNR